ncbi:MAG: ketoacyl-ACP synthase III [Rhodobacteraceae bacterium]|nr:ketoacyl-ACP synthase III [Paracoccaceae bacterium]
MLRAVPVGVGHALPGRVVPNSEFESFLDTTDSWIHERTGIRRRHFAADGELTSHLATDAARNALEDARLRVDEIDAIVLATSTPDQTFPSTATRVQAALGATRSYAFDLHAVCAGFVYAIGNANALIVSGQARRVLVIGSETFSRIMNWQDRTTCVLFGDGAGALVLEAREGRGDNEDRGILSCKLKSDGRLNQILYVDGGVSSTQTTGVLVMEGREVFRHAVAKLAEVAHEVLDTSGLSESDVDWVVPHQANLRIIRKTAQKMGIPMERVILTVQDHGNTSAASIPLALSVAKQQGKLKENQVILTEAIGGGLTWGAALFRW